MKHFARKAALLLAAGVAAGCTSAGQTALPEAMAPTPTPRPETADARPLDGMIAHYADAYDVPETLVRRVVARESNYNPKAYNAGNWGLMQIRYGTARTMGYDGAPEGLLDAGTNLAYAVKYLRGAYLVAGGDPDQAVRLYQRGYYYDAKRKGVLEETGLKPGAQTAVAQGPGGDGRDAPEAVAEAATAAPDSAPATAFAGRTPSDAPLPAFRPRR